jgi:hypothetical protein
VVGDTVYLTRSELYDQVWSEPMATLARRYRLSDVGLAKICRRLRIPVPYRGYWSKLAAQRKPHRTKLPVAPPSAAETFAGVTLRRRGEDDPDEAPAVVAQEHHEALPANRITVPERLSAPHTLVAKAVAALRRTKPDDQGFLRPQSACLHVRVTLDSADRAMNILDALLKALEVRGFATAIRTGDWPGTYVRIGEEDVGIALEERVRRVELPRPDSSKGYLSWSKQYEWQPTGQLTLRIANAFDSGMRQSWADGKAQRVEDCLGEFIVGLVKAAEVIKARRLEREARARQQRAAEERREAALRRQAEEEARIRALDHAVAAWSRARTIREYVAAFRAAGGQGVETDASTAIAEWLAWAEAFGDRLDPLHPGPSVPEDPEPRRPRTYGWPDSFARSREPEVS